MGKVLVIIAASLGGWLGWWLGEGTGVMGAFLLSMVGTGLGIYAARRFLADLL